MYCNDAYGFNPPYTAEQVQWANGRFNPVGVKVDSAVLAYYERAFFDRLSYFMEITGAPDIWDKNYMYYSMFRYGYVGVVDAVGRNGERFGEIPQFGTLGGIGLFLQPTRLSVVNKFIDMPLLKINEECGILQLTNDYRGIWDIIRRYAIKMALIDKTFDMSLINSRVSTFVFAKTKEAAMTLKAAEDKAQAGEPMVIFDKEILCPDDPDTMKEPFVTWDRDVRNTFIAPELADLHRSIMNEFDSEIGIPNANLQKKERMTENEIDENNGETYSRITNWIDTFNRTAAVGCNKLYGLNIHARIRGEIDVSNNNASESDDME